MSPGIVAYDDTAAAPAGQGLAAVDQRSLAEEVLGKNPNRLAKHPFRRYWELVVATSGVPDAQETRQMASYICGEVAKLPFLPDSEMQIPVPGSNRKTTEFEQQVEKTARRAEDSLDSAMVWTASALKLARAALEMRRDHPLNAWVNDPLPGGDRAIAPLPSAFMGEDDSDTGQDGA